MIAFCAFRIPQLPQPKLAGPKLSYKFHLVYLHSMFLLANYTSNKFNYLKDLAINFVVDKFILASTCRVKNNLLLQLL